MSKDKISFDEFLSIEEKLEFKVGEVVGAKRIPKKNNLLELIVSFGEDGIKPCVTNLGKQFEPETFIGNLYLFITNLEPANLGGVLSEVMIMVGVSDNGEISLELNKGQKLL